MRVAGQRNPPQDRTRPGSFFEFSFGGSSRAAIRASDQDRELTAQQLADHHAAGRLTLDELRERTDRVYDARTVTELDAVLADLPGTRLVPKTPWDAVVAARRRGPFPGYAYAGFWVRAGGLGVDLLAIVALNLGLDPALHVPELFWLIPPVYFTAFWGAVSRTPGMWLGGLRVVRAEDGGRLGLRRSFLRSCGYLLDLASCSIGFLWAAADPRRQAWHDKIAGSLVVRRKN